MLCNKCKQNEAIFHSKSVINGVSSEEHLCANCVDDSKLHSFNDFFEDFFTSPFGLISPNYLGLENLSSIGRVVHNRPNDKYSSYKDVLDQAMNSIRIGASSTSTLSEEEIKLRNELADAVEKEDYELASVIKKKLDALKNKED